MASPHPEQRLLVVERRQGDVHPREHLVERGARDIGVRPADRSVVAVERDPAATRAHAIGDRRERRALRRIEDRERDARKVEEVVALERRRDLLGALAAQHLARGGRRAPVGEAALALGVGADGVQAGQPARQTGDEVGPDALGPPHR